MLVPLFGFVISLAIALLLASAVVRLDRKLRSIRGATIAFVVSAFVGAAAYGRTMVRCLPTSLTCFGLDPQS